MPRSADPRPPLPNQLRGVFTVLILQGVFNSLGAVIVLDVLDDRVSHGQDDHNGLLRALVVLGFTVAAVQIAGAVLVFRRRGWIPPLITTVEGLVVVSGIVSLVAGNVLVIIGIILAIVVMVVVNTEQAHEWFHPDAPTGSPSSRRTREPDEPTYQRLRPRAEPETEPAPGGSDVAPTHPTQPFTVRFVGLDRPPAGTAGPFPAPESPQPGEEPS
jgi:hypothetical protein